MTRYLDDHNNLPVDEKTGLPLEQVPDDDEDEDITAGGRRAFSAWHVIGTGIVIVLLATAGAALWPRQTTDPTQTASTTPAVPSAAEPSGPAVSPKAAGTVPITPGATDKAQ
ncbi:hypothetical protein NE852_18040 [Rhizobium sp. Pop5]|uniref:hypothetical protein n=1 Tax=Rhizobium sp. Pop5 TaxID=1223565 RepID=UPI000283D4D2|nr:hypothetical protein [Rhizobium sp. Pop5]EJZ17022.1 hypothetical protein RCCGEPOP_32908 [Rhizobium sp. Pop5]UVD55965.1 hypothetical protein NE852_18040 [Rhizobium sp. Pop5]